MSLVAARMPFTHKTMLPLNYVSRYSQGTLTRVKAANGVYNIALYRPVASSTSKYSLYTWKPFDRPDSVAAKVLGDPTLWWAIFDYNPEVIYPFNVPPGTVIRIPKNPIVTHGTLVQ